MPHPVLSEKRLIVNGDDFGLSAQVNAGIIHAHRVGILTNASLLVTGPAWEEAVALAATTPTLGVGLHLTLVQGRAVLSPQQIPDLTDNGGNFPNNPTLAGLRYFFSPRARRQMKDECRAQLERFLASGLSLSHVDGHLNIHMHPVVLRVLLDLAREYRIAAMRLTREQLSVSLALDARHALRKCWESLIFSILSWAAKRKLRAGGMAFPDALFGLHQSGTIDERYLLSLLPRVGAYVTELYCHPSFLPCPEVQRWTPTYRRDVELAALTSPAVHAVVRGQGIKLISYKELYVNAA